MLLREDGRRHEHGHLLAVHGRLISRAYGDFRLAEADVAAEQAVHGLLFLHVRLDLRDGAQLVFRLLVGECVLELALAHIVRREGMAFGLLALRVDLDELLRDVLDRLLGARLGLDPLRAAHAVQARHIALRADILLQEADLVRRHEELVVARVLDVQVVLVDAADIERLDAEVLADTVALVHDIVTDR